MHIMHISTALMALLSSASALTLHTFTTQFSGAVVDFAAPVTIYWGSVEPSDPETFKVELVNDRIPSLRYTLATGISTSSASHTIEPTFDGPVGHGFQLNLVSEDHDTPRLLAETHRFIAGRSHNTYPSTAIPLPSPTLSNGEDTSTLAPPNQPVVNNNNDDSDVDNEPSGSPRSFEAVNGIAALVGVGLGYIL